MLAVTVTGTGGGCAVTTMSMVPFGKPALSLNLLNLLPSGNSTNPQLLNSDHVLIFKSEVPKRVLKLSNHTEYLGLLLFGCCAYQKIFLKGPDM